MKNFANLKKTLKLSLIGWFIATNVAAAQAKDVMRELVEETAEIYVYQNADVDNINDVQISVRDIDERINIPACPVDLQASSSTQSLRQSNITVRVSCPSNGWFHYLSVSVTEMQEVVVLADTVSPGTLLTENNLTIEKVDKRRIRGGTFADIKEVVGARLKRRSRDGTTISPNMLCFVCKGDAVVITASLSGLEIKTSGVALQDGNIGDRISVQNRRSKKQLEAEVANVNEVRVQI